MWSPMGKRVLHRYLASYNITRTASSSLHSKSLPSSVRVVEVGPRDGLQNEKSHVPTETKVAMIHKLIDSGIKHIEVTSFVSPKWVPQMSDNSLVCSLLERQPGVKYSVLTPNLKGYEAALAAKVSEVAIFAAASESFSKKNINCSISESLKRFLPVCEAARKDGIPVRGYVSCVVACPYEGKINPKEVAQVARYLINY